jgi:catechol 2,3-dioxygenase-like lactoylglutathione lyase family enzyme
VTAPAPGIAVYAKDPRAVARFYAAIAGLEVVDEAEGHVALGSEALELIVVRIPADVADTIEIASPPVRREETPVKPLLPVASLAGARAVAASLGGVVDGVEREWAWHGVTVVDGQDPEGNVFQLRAPSRVASTGPAA